MFSEVLWLYFVVIIRVDGWCDCSVTDRSDNKQCNEVSKHVHPGTWDSTTALTLLLPLVSATFYCNTPNSKWAKYLKCDDADQIKKDFLHIILLSILLTRSLCLHICRVTAVVLILNCISSCFWSIETND